MTCKHQDGCPREVSFQGWCRFHWRRLRETGEPGPVDKKPPRRRQEIACKHPAGCEQAARCQGWCAMHWRRLRGRGDAGGVAKEKKRNLTCKHQGCVRPSRLRDLCAMHAQRLERLGELGPAGRITLRHDDAPEGMRTCTRCRVVQPLLSFVRNRQVKGGIGYYCRPCLIARCKVSKYGISAPTKTSCEVCGSTKKLCIDHDHATGKVRGTLCDACNKVLGLMNDDPARLRAAATYLETVPSTIVFSATVTGAGT